MDRQDKPAIASIRNELELEQSDGKVIGIEFKVTGARFYAFHHLRGKRVIYPNPRNAINIGM